MNKYNNDASKKDNLSKDENPSGYLRYQKDFLYTYKEVSLYEERISDLEDTVGRLEDALDNISARLLEVERYVFAKDEFYD